MALFEGIFIKDFSREDLKGSFQRNFSREDFKRFFKELIHRIFEGICSIFKGFFIKGNSKGVFSWIYFSRVFQGIFNGIFEGIFPEGCAQG